MVNFFSALIICATINLLTMKSQRSYVMKLVDRYLSRALVIFSIVALGIFAHSNQPSELNSIYATADTDNLVIRTPFYEESDARIFQLEISDAIRDDSYSYYSIKIQEQLLDKVDDLKATDTYNIDNPLLILNPFGTLTNSLYVFFQDDRDLDVNYHITSHLNGQEQVYSQQAFLGDQDQEFLLMGLIPGADNQVTIELTDGAQQVQAS